MELEIESVYDEMKVPINKAIIERLDLIRKYYVVIEDKEASKDGYRYFAIYKKPTSIPENVIGNLMFYQLKDIYYITNIRIKDDTIYADAYTPDEVIIIKGMLTYSFNNIDGVKIKIIKQYCDYEFTSKSKTFEDALKLGEDIDYK